jgi:hypothetical protein
MKPLTEQQMRILKEINEEVPKHLYQILMKVQYANPSIRKVVDRGLRDKSVSPEVKEKLEILKMSDEYSAVETVVDPKIERQIERVIEKGLKRAIKSGALPPLTTEDFFQVKNVEGN